jgi:endo-1,4-beta-xylanase
MLSLAFAVSGVFAAVANVVGAAPFETPLQPRQNGFTIQNWSNDIADVDFTNGAGGAFSVDWNNRPGGNFVVGKGYKPARDM